MNFYLIHLRKRAAVLYTETGPLQSTIPVQPDADSLDPLDRFLLRLEDRNTKWSRFLRNLIVAVRDGYYKLENKIDPMERVFKRLRHASELTLHYSPSLGEEMADLRFRALLLRQRRRHTFWVFIDSFLALGALALSPILVPIPGPNLFLYYPALRMFSHYLARRGAMQGLRIMEKRFEPLSEISHIEALLAERSSPQASEQIQQLAAKLKLDHFPQFIERYS